MRLGLGRLVTLSTYGLTVRDRDEYATSWMRRFPIDASAGLLRHEHCEPRSKANLHVFGTPDTIVLNSDDKIVRPLLQFDLNRAATITRKRVLQGVGHHLIHDDSNANRSQSVERHLFGAHSDRDRPNVSERLAQPPANSLKNSCMLTV
jgi:hypothetical protein